MSLIRFCRKLDIPCMVVAPPTHIENHLLGYRPILGFDGADVLADEIYTTATLGMEKHLIDLFGDAGLEYEDGATEGQADEETMRRGDEEPQDAADAVAIGQAPDLPASRSPGLPVWSPEAQAMLKKVPFFVRGRVQKNVEKYAAQQGHGLITVDVLQAAKESLGG